MLPAALTHALRTPRMRGRHRAVTPLRTGRRIALATVAIAALLAGPFISAPPAAFAAEGEYLQISKTVDKSVLVPGESFSYRVQVTCSELDCVNASLVDPLPTELAGFPVQGVEFTPAESTVPRSVTWTTNAGTSPTAPAAIDSATVVSIGFEQPIGAGDMAGLGLDAGQTFTMLLTLAVPANYPPGNSGDIVNIATTDADNALPRSADATIVIDSAIAVDVDVTKLWSPATAAFLEGAASNIALSATNTSNVSAEKLIIQEPKTAAAGATALDPSNPFTITTLTGFTATTPAGCLSTQVDAYVSTGGVWNWAVGGATDPSAMVLPTGVQKADVGGLRVTCTGVLSPADALGLQLNLAQRGGLPFAAYTVNNVATGSALVTGQPVVSADASASHAIAPLKPSVEAAKNIEPKRIAAGQTTTATIGATNGAIPAASLSLADPGFFTSDVTFGGWVDGITYPPGATSGIVVYILSGGGTQTETFGTGGVPIAPGSAITGFELKFGGVIEAAASVNAKFTIATSATATGTLLELTKHNDANATVVDLDGQIATATARDSLTVVAPGIDTSLIKRVLPSGAVEPGESVYVSLEANARAITDTSNVHDIVVEDSRQSPSGDSDFWNAFDLTAVAPTQIPANTTLKIEVLVGTTWTEVVSYNAESLVRVVQLTEADLGGVSNAEGIRFSFHNVGGFAQDTTVSPLIIFTAREVQRDGGPITPGVNDETPYENYATAIADGESDAGTPLTDKDSGEGIGTIVTTPRVGPGTVSIEKNWRQATVNAQTGNNASTRLDWNVEPGFESVVITDPQGGYGNPSATVFDAFDLVGASSISANATPFSNGWYLRYDTISSIELWNATGATPGWETVDAPVGGWIQNGQFAGGTLTPQQQADTQGIRITLVENTAARNAALVPGATFDAFAPAAGSGVGASTSSVDRTFTLNWKLRDKARSDDRWVTAKVPYNATDNGLVLNSTALDATPTGGGQAVRATDADTIRILDRLPGVLATKTVTPSAPLFVPPAGSASAKYPAVSWTITAKNNSVAPASYVRVTDPANCLATVQTDCQLASPKADPFTAVGTDWLASPGGTANPTNRFDITKVSFSASIPAEVSLAHSVVWLLRYDSAAEVTTSEQSTASAVAGMTRAQLADVIGVSVTFQAEHGGDGVGGVGGTITAANVLTVTLDSVLRATLRNTGAPQLLKADNTVDVTNRVFAQSYDPVLSPGATTGDLKDVKVVLTGGTINITPLKTITPAQIVVANPDVPVTVRLGANQGTSPRSTLSPSVVTIEDQADSPEFWNSFDFTGLGTVTRPAGANLVRVDAYGPFGAGGALVWVEGTASATAAMPVLPMSFPDVQGIRFVFTNGTAGAFFSQTVPAPNWSTSATFTAQLRDTYRASGNDVAFAGTINNTQTSVATRTDGNNSEMKADAKVVTLSLGTQQLSVNKLTNDGDRSAAVGESVPFRLTVKNTGTGYLTLTNVTDSLPAELVWLGSTAPVYTAAAGGTLSTDVALALDPDGRTMTFTWPQNGRTMQPGEVFTIDLLLELQPGLAPGASALNTMTANTVETLARCGNTNAPGQGTTNAWAQDPTSCGTTDFVKPVSGPNLFTVKGVNGSMSGASVPGRPDISCAPTLTATGGTYYRTPCIANSSIGGVDDWVLRAANAGTFTVKDMIIFDQLPTPGDQLLISGNSRGTQFRPELVANSIEVLAPAGTKTVVEVTTSDSVCSGTWTNLIGQAPCEQAGESWSIVDASTSWAAVTGIRVKMDFTDLSANGLTGGQIVDVTYSTHNVLASADSPLGVSTAVPSADLVAVNQHGVKYTDQSATKKIAPAVVGVQLLTGSIEIRKETTGAAAEYAPDAFIADVTCQLGGVALDLASAATVTLSSANDYTVRIDGIPYSVGTPPECTIAETGTTGAFGETSRTIDPLGGVVVIREPSTVTDAVPSAQIVTLTNDYGYSGLSVTKTIATKATDGEFGPFTFGLTCLSGTGAPVTFDSDGQTLLTFTLQDGETFTAPANRLPVRSECTLTETDGFFADTIAIVGSNTVDNGDASATITLGNQPAIVTVTNGYDAGTFTVLKTVDGLGADAYGVGTYQFSAVCIYQAQTLLDAKFELERDATRSFGVYPAGTECAVEEIGAGGATAAALTPTSGTVTIPAPTDNANVGEVTVTATNTFDIGSLEVVKEVVGEGAELYGAGPFTAQVTCTRDRDGTTTAVELAADGIVTLSEANGYRATVDGVIVGAECAVAETDAAGATSTTVAPKNGVITIPAGQGETPIVTITNTFDVTSIDVTKVVQGNPLVTRGVGPFEVELVCVWSVNGVETDVLIPGGATRELAEESGYEASYSMLPVGSVCSLTETNTGGANDTAITVLVEGNDDFDVTGITAEVDISETTAPGQARVIVTNTYYGQGILPFTGVQSAPLIALMLTLFGAGGLLLIIARRRRAHSQR